MSELTEKEFPELMLRNLVGRQISSLRQRLHDAIDAEVQGGNVRVILWLADRLKLITPDDKKKPSSSLDDLLRSMTEQDIQEFESLKD